MPEVPFQNPDSPSKEKNPAQPASKESKRTENALGEKRRERSERERNDRKQTENQLKNLEQKIANSGKEEPDDYDPATYGALLRASSEYRDAQKTVFSIGGDIDRLKAFEGDQKRHTNDEGVLEIKDFLRLSLEVKQSIEDTAKALKIDLGDCGIQSNGVVFHPQKLAEFYTKATKAYRDIIDSREFQVVFRAWEKAARESARANLDYDQENGKRFIPFPRDKEVKFLQGKDGRWEARITADGVESFMKIADQLVIERSQSGIDDAGYVANIEKFVAFLNKITSSLEAKRGG